MPDLNNPKDTPISLDKSLSQGFILQVTIFIAPENVLEFFQLFKPIYNLVIAEPECRFFVVGENSQEPGCITWTEGWSKDVDWFTNVQIKKEYYVEYLEKTEAMFLKPRQAMILTPQPNLTDFKLSEQ